MTANSFGRNNGHTTPESAWIERILRSESSLAELERLDSDAALDQIRKHGAGGLVLAALRRQGLTPGWLASLRDEQRAAALWELRHQHLMRRAIDTLAAARCEPIVMKGTALAYWLYADPLLRPRGDTDVLVREDKRRAAEAALVQAGFTRRFGIEGDVVTHQATYSLMAADGRVHALDLHWRANNSPVIAPLFPHSELMQFSEPLPQLGPAARRVDALRSLLLACVHRAVHEANPYYADGETVNGLSRLVWLYDIFLLSEALSPSAWSELPAICRAKGVARIVSEALDDAARRLGASFPDDLPAALGSSGTREAAYRYVRADKSGQRWMDWNALDWPDRLRLVREVALPAPSYMRARYADQKTWLPWLYVRRIATGARPARH